MKQIAETLLIIDAPHFYAGAIVENGTIKKAAPIIKWTRGKTIEQVKTYCFKKGWGYVVKSAKAGHL
jgi:hypothetical protein